MPSAGDRHRNLVEGLHGQCLKEGRVSHHTVAAGDQNILKYDFATIISSCFLCAEYPLSHGHQTADPAPVGAVLAVLSIRQAAEQLCNNWSPTLPGCIVVFLHLLLGNCTVPCVTAVGVKLAHCVTDSHALMGTGRESFPWHGPTVHVGLWRASSNASSSAKKAGVRSDI